MMTRAPRAPGARTVAILAAAGLVATTLTSCSGHPAGAAATKPSIPVASATVGSGIATIAIDGKAQMLSIQRCVDALNGGLNVVAATSSNPPSTMILNLTTKLTTSTLVWTAVAADNSFTTYAVGSAPGGAVSANRTGNNLSVAGTAVAQVYGPSGKTAGPSTRHQLVLDAACPHILPLQPAPSIAGLQHGSIAKSVSPAAPSSSHQATPTISHETAQPH